MSFNLQHIFTYPWSKVTQAFWEKYPHPSVPHVKEAIVLSRDLDESGRLITRRLMCVQQSVPASLRPFSRGYDTFYAVEETIVDAKARTLELTTHNVTFSRMVQALTKTKYEAIDYNDGKGEQTLLTTNITVTAGKFPRLLAGRVETALGNHSMKNADRGLIAMEELCAGIFKSPNRFS